MKLLAHFRAELAFNNRNKKTKNIYWNYREDNADSRVKN